MSDSKNQSFKVFIRCRPLNEKETSCFSNRKSVSIIEPATVSLVDIDNRETFYNYDGVFTQISSTQEIFQHSVQPVINHFINGYNSTVFAYGITGAGKSYTMFGSEEHFGLIPLTIESILRNLEDEKWNLKMSYIEIYNEQIFDLLVEKSDNLQVIEDPDKGVIVMDVQERQIKHFENAHQYIGQGNTRRVMAQTYANDFSSRSHAIVLLTLQRQIGDKVVTAKMSLVDLAGSEKATVYTGQNKGANRLQGSNINKSLLALGNCIMILSQNSKKSGFVPYRDSKLTRLLKDSLGGNTKTVMIACISQSPLCYDQTLSTLKYAGRARKIQKTVVQNTKQSHGSNEQLRAQMQKLKKQNQLLKIAQTKDIVDKKSKSAKLQNLLNNLIQTVKQTIKIQTQIEQQSCRIDDSYLQNTLVERESIIQQIIKTAIGQTDSCQSSHVVHRPTKTKNNIKTTRDYQRSKTIYKHSDEEPKPLFQLNSLNHVRSHRRRNSIIHSESMSNTITFLNNYSNLEESKVPIEPISQNHPILNKSQSTYVMKQAVVPTGGRKSKHLNILKEIQAMSQRLMIMSNQKTRYHKASIRQGVEQVNQIQNYQQDEIL